MQPIPEKIINDLNKILLKMELVATPEYLEKLLYKTELKKDMIEINGVDTAEREIFFDILAYKLTGKYWPLNGDTEEKTLSFFEDFIDAVENEDGLNFIPKKTLLDIVEKSL